MAQVIGNGTTPESRCCGRTTPRWRRGLYLCRAARSAGGRGTQTEAAGCRRMDTPQDRAKAFLTHIGGVIGRELTAADQIDSQIVSLDIEKGRLRRTPVSIGRRNGTESRRPARRWVSTRTNGVGRLGVAASSRCVGIDKSDANGIVTSSSGVNWATRTDRNGSGTVAIPMNRRGTNASHPSDHYETLDISRCQFITDDASLALRKMPVSWSTLCQPAPLLPYRRDYGGPFGGSRRRLRADP